MSLRFDTATGTATLDDWSAPFGWGRAGTVTAERGREGDAKTPLGTYRLRFGFYRADRLPRLRTTLKTRATQVTPATPTTLKTQPILTMHAIQQDDGWCDDSDDPAYNRFVRRPFPARHERLWREDGAYDVVLVMSHNDSPPVPDRGSAVFIHCRQPDHRPTLGCLALAPGDMWRLLPKLRMGLKVAVI